MSKQEIKSKIAELNEELERLEGKRKICSICGEEKHLANWGSSEPPLCLDCSNKKKIKEQRKKYSHLIGLTIEDIIVDEDSIQGFILDGYRVELRYYYDRSKIEISKIRG